VQQGQASSEDAAEHKGAAVITIIDYRAGNLASVQKAITHLGVASRITEDPEVIRRADQLLLPGVGHFSATARLTKTGVRDAVLEAIGRGVPFMGICVGMQWLFEGSTEAPDVPGIGVFKGMVARFACDMKIPHVGWNTIEAAAPARLLQDVSSDGFVYYTHSYRAPVVEGVVATTTYGEQFAAAVERDNVFGVQFHPEKSSTVGLQLLRNFCKLREEVTC
jgi:imidazole glycerol-phosphate synthase subunit HisH